MRIKVLLVEPGQMPRQMEVEDNIDAFAEVIGGPVEMAGNLPHRMMLFQRESADSQSGGRIRIAGRNAADGPFLLCGYEGSRYVSLTPEQQVQFTAYYAALEGRDAHACASR